MGGHGGLNILPQKKWNVYNYDNRAIVEKDKKKAQEKEQQQYETRREKGLLDKMDVLREERGLTKVVKEKQQSQDVLLNSVNEQFKRIHQKKHINLFENEQKIIQNREIVEIKKLKQAEFLKDKNMDYSSKFLGVYGHQKNIPWYAKSKGHVQQKKKPLRADELISVKKTDSNTTKEVLKLQKNHQKEYQRQNQRSRQKKNKHKHQDSNKTEYEILRQKRLKRQKKQKQKADKIKASLLNL